MSDQSQQGAGRVDNDGVGIAYEVHGEGATTVLLLPPWAVSHSGIWQQQVPVLAQRFRVVTYDPRGNGRSDRPLDPSAHTPEVLLSDAVAVLDAVGVDRCVVVGNSFGTVFAYLLAGLVAARVEGAVFMNPSSLNLDGRTDDPFQQALLHFRDELGTDDGWARLNHRSWQRDFAGFVEWFAGQAFPEPDAGHLRAVAVAWGRETTADHLAATVLGRTAAPVEETAARLRALAGNIGCPTLVIHGQLDPIAPRHRAETLARLLDGELALIDDAGHCPQASRPERVNRLIEAFITERVTAAPASSAG